MTASKIDKIWEVQSGSSSSNRKLADGYTLSNYPVGTSVKCDKNDLNGEADGASTSVYQVSEPGTLRHYPNPTIAGSWDPSWQSSKTIGDCKGLTLGDDLESKDAEGGDAGPVPSYYAEYHCVLHKDAKTNYLNSFEPDHDHSARGFASTEARWDYFYDSSILPSCTGKNPPTMAVHDPLRKIECEAATLTAGGRNGQFKNCQWESIA
jgi:hypothetical protein